MQQNNLSNRIKEINFQAIAAALTSIGLWCFPLVILPQANGHYKKQPLIKWKPYQDRPPTRAELDEWIARYPDAGAGIPTGPATGFWVLDADDIGAIEYVEKRGMPERTWVSRTRRGLHYALRYPDDFTVRGSAGEIATAVDIRGLGGMVVAPGTRCLDGFTYNWVEGHSPADTPLADASDWLLNELRYKAERAVPAASAAPPQTYRGNLRAWSRKAFDANLEILSAAAPGTRNTTFFSVSRRLGQLVGGGELEQSAVLGALNAIANGWPDSAHSHDTIRRGFAAGYATPRTAPAPIRFSRLIGNEPLASTTAALNDESWRRPLGGAV